MVDFFTPAPGVELIDTSEMDFEQSVRAVIAAVRAAAAQDPAIARASTDVPTEMSERQ